MSRYGQRYGIQMGLWRLVVPYAEATVEETHASHRGRVQVPVKRRYGLTQAHALNRVLRWTREHGDPR